MFTDIIKQYSHIEKRINESEVMLDPWPHMYITEIFTPEFYTEVQQFEQLKSLDRVPEHGRVEYIFNKFDEEYIELTTKMFKLFCDKFGYKIDADVPAGATFWVDDSDLIIDDIHVDAFYDTPFTISGQIYLPDDLSLRQYGTKLYKYTGNDLSVDAKQDPGTMHPHIATNLDNFDLVRTVPFYPNCMLVTPNHITSWHCAPTVVGDDIRKSLMLRWKV